MKEMIFITCSSMFEKCFLDRKQSWIASLKPTANSRKPKNLRCKNLKAESWKKVLMIKAESQKFYFSSAFGFLPIFLNFWIQSWNDKTSAFGFRLLASSSMIKLLASNFFMCPLFSAFSFLHPKFLGFRL